MFFFFFGYLDETTTHPNEEDRKNLSWSLYFNNVAGWKPVTLLKKAPTQAPSCEFCENFKNFYFEKHRQTTASITFFDESDETTTYLDDQD